VHHHRYGDLGRIWDKTAGRCHLCHEHVELDTYGLVQVYGRDAATVDHLVPQSHGGLDSRRNLMPAHHGCNASRGTRPVTHARFQMAGTVEAPLSTTGRATLTATAGLGAGALAGHVFATERADGTKQFNWFAALLAGGAAALLTDAAV
jgi:hypothetical protein